MNTERKPMTNEEYLSSKGNPCPYCRSTDISGRSINVEGGTAWQEVICCECGASWNDIYTLVGYEDLEV